MSLAGEEGTAQDLSYSPFFISTYSPYMLALDSML
jgi:hypothetical protein